MVQQKNLRNATTGNVRHGPNGEPGLNVVHHVVVEQEHKNDHASMVFQETMDVWEIRQEHIRALLETVHIGAIGVTSVSAVARATVVHTLDTDDASTEMLKTA